MNAIEQYMVNNSEMGTSDSWYIEDKNGHVGQYLMYYNEKLNYVGVEFFEDGKRISVYHCNNVSQDIDSNNESDVEFRLFDLSDSDMLKYLLNLIAWTLEECPHEKIPTLKEYYREQIETEWKWDQIVKGIEQQEAEADEFGENLYKCLYIGSCLNFYPSERFYLPFASSNVNEWMAEHDEEYREVFEAKLEQYDLSLEFGLGGDGLNVHITKYVGSVEDEEETEE